MLPAHESKPQMPDPGCTIQVGQWRRDDFTFVVLEEPGHPSGTVLCEIRYRGVNSPKPRMIAMPVSRVLRAEVVNEW